MPVTILHISDLHRDAGSHIGSTALMESLRRDMARYVSEGEIPKPDIAVVSGDIVQGVGIGDANAVDILINQYDEAYEFLEELANTFFNGNRERIIIVPGNHDVSMSHVQLASTIEDLPTTPAQLSLLSQQLWQDGSLLRWEWNTFKLRRIIDTDNYNRRFEPFANFYAKFYQGNRTFSLNPKEQFAVHDYPEFGLVFAGLSSCYENDLYNRTGRINPDCVATVTRKIAEYTRRGYLAVAVWHHSIQGGPKDADYVDADILQSLMDGEISLAMHGHQHRPQLVEHRFTADRKRGIVVLSAGTLCGGPRSLPSGRMRAYNLVVLDKANRHGVVHIRDMQNSDFNLPVWGPAHVAEFSGSSLEFSISAPVHTTTSFQDASEADRLLRNGSVVDAYRLVQPHLNDPLARRVAATALGKLQDWNEISSVFNPPTSSDEFVLLCEALDELGKKNELSSLLTSTFALSSADPGVIQCISMMRSRIGGR